MSIWKCTFNAYDMSRKHHNLKLAPQYWHVCAEGYKNFEIRKNDRDFQPGDVVTLSEYKDGAYTGATLNNIIIRYVLTAEQFPDGLQPGYCVLGMDYRKMFIDVVTPEEDNSAPTP